MHVYDVGDALTSTVTFRSDADPPVLTDPTTVTVTVRAPDGTVTDRSAEIVKAAVGVYKLTLVPTTPGVWVVRWVGVGAIAATDEKTYGVKPLGIEGFLLGWYGAGASNRDRLRLLLGDTNNDDVLLVDAEIDWLLERNTPAGGTADFTEATIQGALALAAKFTRAIDGSNGDVSRSYSQRSAAFRALAEALRSNAENALETARRSKPLLPMMAAGGIDGCPDFAVGMMDGAGTVLPGRERSSAAAWCDPRAGDGGDTVDSAGVPGAAGTVEDGGAP